MSSRFLFVQTCSARYNARSFNVDGAANAGRSAVISIQIAVHKLHLLPLPLESHTLRPITFTAITFSPSHHRV